MHGLSSLIVHTMVGAALGAPDKFVLLSTVIVEHSENIQELLRILSMTCHRSC